VEISPDELMLNITVRTELRGEQMSNLSWLVFAAVDSLVKEWYNLNVRSPHSSALPLPHNCSPFSPPRAGQGVGAVLPLHGAGLEGRALHVRHRKVPTGGHLAQRVDPLLSQWHALHSSRQARPASRTANTTHPPETSGGDPKPVRLDHIAPDLAMVHLDRHRIDWADLVKSDSDNKPMAEGKLFSPPRALALSSRHSSHSRLGRSLTFFSFLCRVP
jgi:hypothetical protein